MLCNLFTPWWFRKQRKEDQKAGGATTLQAQPRDPSLPAGPTTKVTSSWDSCVQAHQPLGDFSDQVTPDSMSKTLKIQQRKHSLPSTSIAQLHTDADETLWSVCPLPTGKTVLEANPPLGGSPLLPSFTSGRQPPSPHLKAIPLITLLITQDSTKEEIPSSLWKNHFSIFFLHLMWMLIIVIRGL